MSNTVTVDAYNVKRLREDTGCGMFTCKDVLDRFGGDYDFAKSYLKYAGQAIYIKGGYLVRDSRDLRKTKEELGRDPVIDKGIKSS